ncbi:MULTISPECIES: glutaredoxin domain-containing protein [Virgibacillus]|uniref:Glutaredoxin-like protein, YruB-family n=2 Tax=Virgibacillus TaxID=84406 RepID=A0A024QFB6_9BACI|nr:MULTISPECIES: glutaredoxin domain-containing protein [Virgibacillus]EQB38797.1 hypothetical protein M948_00200 [Virgibacillus sp. CM-4]MYL43849.1 glutaredoxin family protein [Virgibacillus massiliensis]GGJ66145.1 hypothetical protein GCM10007111_30140 [Virgibacillus kapii]CDQ40922.1 glutaredoxin-like protein, YruB-family [Virgibacillus massiliensis]
MADPEVVVFVSNDNAECEKLLEHLRDWNVTYVTKNVNTDSGHMKELQENGIYGTPAMFINGEKEPILGFQKNKIKYRLGLANTDVSHYSSLFEGYEK